MTILDKKIFPNEEISFYFFSSSIELYLPPSSKKNQHTNALILISEPNGPLWKMRRLLWIKCEWILRCNNYSPETLEISATWHFFLYRHRQVLARILIHTSVVETLRRPNLFFSVQNPKNLIHNAEYYWIILPCSQTKYRVNSSEYFSFENLRLAR